MKLNTSTTIFTARLVILLACLAHFLGKTEAQGPSFGPYPSNLGTKGTTITNNNAVNLTNLVQIRSVDIPLGAWTTNGIDTTIGTTITPASLAAVTNTGDGAIFFHTNGTTLMTNTLRTRFSLPWDWDAGTVKVGLQCVCSSTNGTGATNMVWGVRAVAISATDNATNLTFGSIVRVTNNVGTNAWVFGQEGITANLTVGNTPTTAKGILWEVQRQGGDGGDTETNSFLFLAQVRVYYKTASITNFPTSSP